MASTAATSLDDNNKMVIQELDVLSQTLYQAHSARRTPSLVLPRSSDNSFHSNAPAVPETRSRPRPRRLSLSPFRSHQQPEPAASPSQAFSEIPISAEPDKKGGIWGWKPLRALSHIGMHRLAILLSIEVVAVHSLPSTMNGLRLSVVVRKKEAKEGAVQTMPARVIHGAAEFEEILFIRSHIFYSGSGSSSKPLRIEPRPFLIYPVSVDAPDLDFGRSSVDLSLLVKESLDKSFEGSRVRQRESAFQLSGKAKGGKLEFKLGFQIMEDGGAGVLRQSSEIATGSFADSSSSSSKFARRQSKSSFSISSPRGARSAPSVNPSKDGNSALVLKGIEDFNLDEDQEPAPAPLLPSPKSMHGKDPRTADDLEILDFEVVDKGFEPGLGEKKDVNATSSQVANEVLASTSASAEVVNDSIHSVRLTELESIAKQIEALELMMLNEKGENEENSDHCSLLLEGAVRQQLNAEEETATREFLQMLELEDDNGLQQLRKAAKPSSESAATGYLPDLGKGLGPIVHTKDGGFLASMNPFDVEVLKKETPKLAMQISRPIIIEDGDNPSSGSRGGAFFEVFQKLAGMGSEELELKFLSLTSMDELVGKTAEQIAFEGIASAILSGRNRELAKSAAARSIAALKSIAMEINEGRKERIAAGIWNVREEPLASVEEALSFSLQKIEAMAVEALKLQAGAAEEDAPFTVSPIGCSEGSSLLDSAEQLEDWLKGGSEAQSVILMLLVQLRDPLRLFEAVGAPMISMVQVARVDGDEERRYKVCGLHIAGMRLSSRKTRSIWDGERQRLKAMQWVVSYGMAKAGKCGKAGESKEGKDVIWSLSSRVMADMWLKTTRNPDVKLLQL